MEEKDNTQQQAGQGDEVKETAPQAPQQSGDGVFDYVWKFFCSLKLTVFLLIALAVVSILGTIIDQTDPAKNMNGLIRIFGNEQQAKVALDWIMLIGLDRMYKSWWFVGLLATLCANITACSVDRLPRVFRIIGKPMEPLDEKSVKSLQIRQTVTLGGSVEEAKSRVAEALGSSGFGGCKVVEQDGAVHMMRDTGGFARLGVYITHFSVLVIFIGAIIGALWGFKGNVQIEEGQATNRVWLREIPLISNPKITEVSPGRYVYNANFEVRCDKFELQEYVFRNRPTGMPSDYISHLTVLKDGAVDVEKTIEVNDPLKYQGIKFYQSSYGISGTNARMTIRVRNLAGGKPIFRDYPLRRNETAQIEGSDYYMKITDMAPDVVISQQNQLVPQSDQYKGRGAAMMVFLDSDGHMVDKASIIDERPGSQPTNVPFSFDIVNYSGGYYTGLQVTYDPGVLVVYGGFITMVVGIFVAFFIFHKRLWVWVRRDERGKVAVTIAGSVNKNRQAYERDIDKVVEKLKA